MSKQTVRVRPPAKPQDTVVLATVHAGQMSAYYDTSLVNMVKRDAHGDSRISGRLEEWSSANISPARNALVRRFLEDYTADWLLFIDSDMQWEPEAMDELIASADPADRPIVGGLCFGASGGRLFPTIYHLVERDGRLMTLRVNDYERDALVVCSATGAAFLLVHRSVLLAVQERAFNATFPWFQETEMGGLPAGEDITFCMRAAICGFPVHVNTSVKVGHHKSVLLDEGLFTSQGVSAPDVVAEGVR